jgi:hypothetical protein
MWKNIKHIWAKPFEDHTVGSSKRIRDVYPGSEFFQPGSVDATQLQFLSRRRIVVSKKCVYLRALLSK